MELSKAKRQLLEHIRLQESTGTEWAGGKPLGRIYEENESWITEVHDPKTNITHKKTFPFAKYQNDSEQARKVACNWSLYISHKHQCAMNSYKVVDDKYILVRLSENLVTLMDIRYINIIYLVDLNVVDGSPVSFPEANIKYVYCSKGQVNTPLRDIVAGKSKAHYVTKYTMDNRSVNVKLLDQDLAETQQGIKYHQTKKSRCWRARIKVDNKDHTNSYDIGTYGYDSAKLLAMQWRNDQEQGKGLDEPADLAEIQKISDEFLELMARYEKENILDGYVYDLEKQKQIPHSTKKPTVKEYPNKLVETPEGETEDNEDDSPRMDITNKPDIEDPVAICDYLLQYIESLG